MILQAIAERVPFGGRLVSWLLGAAWGLLTIFAIPVLAIEGCGAPRCVRRSGQLLRERWGEGVAGSLTIGAAFFVVAFPAGMVLGAGGGILPFNPALGVALLVAGLGLIMLINGVAMAVRGVFAVALYRYAADGAVKGGFPQADLDRPFRPKRKLFRRR